MEERASGIILRTRPLTETSLIVHWLTPDHGRISCVAKGARRPKSPFVGKLDLFYEADFSFQRSRRSELHTLREVILQRTHAKLREDITRVQQASYFAVLIERTTEMETPLPEIHWLLHQALEAVTEHESGAATVFGFEIKLLATMGVLPPIESLPVATQNLAQQLLESNFSRTSAVPADSETSRQLNRFLRVAIGTALERLPLERERTLQSLGF
jgi:DNA repair protein RecO (recombination protein O)